MTVSELIKQLQDCDKPDADVMLTIRRQDGLFTADAEASDVYYTSIISDEVTVEGRYA